MSSSQALKTGRLIDTLLRVYRTAPVRRLVNRCLPFAPAFLRRYLERERFNTRLRERIIAVRPDAYRALVERGIGVLQQRVGGPANLGDYLEFGVFNGSSLLAACRQTASMNLAHMRLFGFDSFQGLPASAQDEDGGVWTAGAWRSELDFTKAVLDAEGVDWNRVTLVPGWFSDTCTGDTASAHHITKASVIMVDCDLYSSAKQALDFCAPLITDVALVMFDDWHAGQLAEKSLGEKKAFEEWLVEWNCFSAEPFGRYAARSETFLVTRKS